MADYWIVPISIPISLLPSAVLSTLSFPPCALPQYTYVPSLLLCRMCEVHVLACVSCCLRQRPYGRIGQSFSDFCRALLSWSAFAHVAPSRILYGSGSLGLGGPWIHAWMDPGCFVLHLKAVMEVPFPCRFSPPSPKRRCTEAPKAGFNASINRYRRKVNWVVL